VATVVALGELRVALEELTAELVLVRAELIALNAKTPALVGGKVPALVTANGTMPVTTTQLPANLSNDKVKVTGLL
jgi:hypothetical protein